MHYRTFLAHSQLSNKLITTQLSEAAGSSFSPCQGPCKDCRHPHSSSLSWAGAEQFSVNKRSKSITRIYLSLPGGQEAAVCNCPVVLCINLFMRKIIFNSRKQQYLHIPLPTFSLETELLRPEPLDCSEEQRSSYPGAAQHKP